MTIRAGYFESTVSFAITNTPDAYTVPGAPSSRHTFLVQSDVTMHIDRSGTDAQPSTSLRIPADTLVLVCAFAGDTLSYVKGGGADDGTIWLTKVDH